MQPPGDLRERGSLQPVPARSGRELLGPRAPAQKGVELGIGRLGRRLREVDEPGDTPLVDHHIGAVQIAVDEHGAVVREQPHPVLDPGGDVREQACVMIGSSPGGLDLRRRSADDGRVVRGPRLAGERIGQPRWPQVLRNRHLMQGPQRRAEALDQGAARGPVRLRPRRMQGAAGQPFGDGPRPVGPVPVRDVRSVGDLGPLEQADDSGLVAVGVAEPSVAQPDHVVLADPRPADPAVRGEVGPTSREPGSLQSPQQCRIDGRFDGGRLALGRLTHGRPRHHVRIRGRRAPGGSRTRARGPRRRRRRR